MNIPERRWPLRGPLVPRSLPHHHDGSRTNWCRQRRCFRRICCPQLRAEWPLLCSPGGKSAGNPWFFTWCSTCFYMVFNMFLHVVLHVFTWLLHFLGMVFTYFYMVFTTKQGSKCSNVLLVDDNFRLVFFGGKSPPRGSPSKSWW